MGFVISFFWREWGGIVGREKYSGQRKVYKCDKCTSNKSTFIIVVNLLETYSGQRKVEVVKYKQEYH